MNTRPGSPPVSAETAALVQRKRLLHAALYYARTGWHVFPLTPNEKRPAIKGWEDRATTDADRIRAAWTHAPYGIGIACGPSGLVVIDLDVPKPGADGQTPQPPQEWRLPGIRDGSDVFSVVCQAAGQLVPWHTYSVNTASRGIHLYYAAPERQGAAPLRNTAGQLGWLIDSRAHGGYVVAPPTTVDGNPYTIASDAVLAPLPHWLTSTLTPAPLPPQRPVTVPLNLDTEPRRAAYLRDAIDRSVRAVTTAPAGQRNRSLYGAAVSLGQLVAGAALPAEHVTATLQAAAQQAGLTPAEAARTITSGLKAGVNRPRHLPHPAPQPAPSAERSSTAEPQPRDGLTFTRGPRGGVRAVCGRCGASAPVRADRDSWSCPSCRTIYHCLTADSAARSTPAHTGQGGGAPSTTHGAAA